MNNTWAMWSQIITKITDWHTLLAGAVVIARRVARIWKRGGGYFERVRSVQTTLTQIFIDLESVADGLYEN